MAATTIKCPNCGGPLNWNADKMAYFCDYCRSSFSQEEVEKLRPETAEASEETASADTAETKHADHVSAADAYAGDTEQDPQTKKHPALMRYSCPNCGAQLMTDETTAASVCYYCHNPVVLSDRLSGEWEPDLIAPFAVSRERAEEIFFEWMRRHRYIPKDFYNEEQLKHLSGVYFPYWIYDCTVSGEISGEGTRLNTWIAGNMQFTRTSVYDLSRSGTMQVNEVTRLALKKASRVLCESVMPFDSKAMQPFSGAYLQGYTAEMRDIEREALAGEVKQEVQRFAEEKMKSDAENKYQTVRIDQLKAEIGAESWRYALMPVWTLTYQDEKSGKTYYFSINGQTGKTCGELPVDGKRLMRLFLAVFLPVAVLCFLVLYWLG